MVSTPVLFDTNIFIDYLRGIRQARSECDKHSDRAGSIITWMEVMAGSTAANEPA
jgi:predicted nucleic acid-binding protein